MQSVRRVDLDSVRSGQAHYPNIARSGSKQRVNLGLQVPLVLAGIGILDRQRRGTRNPPRRIRDMSHGDVGGAQIVFSRKPSRASRPSTLCGC